jgi:hypothetical protein
MLSRLFLTQVLVPAATLAISAGAAISGDDLILRGPGCPGPFVAKHPITGCAAPRSFPLPSETSRRARCTFRLLLRETWAIASYTANGNCLELHEFALNFGLDEGDSPARSPWTDMHAELRIGLDEVVHGSWNISTYLEDRFSGRLARLGVL